ncbi:MAG: ComF family protein [Alphaproteobacteria bacterium]|nr:ComF family protein [Alphaproteobacteria bacterium]
MVKIFNRLLDFLYPPICPVCGDLVESHGVLCASCWSRFNWISNPKCFKCGYPFPADLDLGSHPMCPHCASGECDLDFIRSACVYDDVSKNIMLPFKHASQLKYKNLMSRAMINALRDLDLSVDIVMPVPLAWKRLFKRGYNQACVLARPIAKHFNAALDVNSVSRKYRPDMGHKTSKQRRENVHGVFKVINKDKIAGKKILLVDDVMTSGATFYELNRILRNAGASAVYAVSFCRVVHAI